MAHPPPPLAPRDDVNIFVVLKAMGCESDQEAVQAVVGGGFGAKLVPAPAGAAGAAGGGGKGSVIAPDAASGEGAAALAALLVPSVQEAKGLGVFTQMQALDYLGESRGGERAGQGEVWVGVGERGSVGVNWANRGRQR